MATAKSMKTTTSSAREYTVTLTAKGRAWLDKQKAEQKAERQARQDEEWRRYANMGGALIDSCRGW